MVIGAHSSLTEVAMNIAGRLGSTFKSAFRRLVTQVPKVTEDSASVEVPLQNTVEKYPLVWLRDNCQCEKCFHAATNSRIIQWDSFSVNVKAKSVEATEKSNLQVTWEDGHQSTYSYDWLKSRSFSKAAQDSYNDKIYRPTKVLWDKTHFKDILHTYDYQEVISSKQTFYEWLKALVVYGVVMMENAPVDDRNIIRKLANKIAFIRKTHYGEDYEITAKPGARNLAYLSNPLQLHTDLPYYDYTTGAIFLHCIVQTKAAGGENILTDGFYVAEKLRAENKAAFDILSQTKVNWFDVGAEEGLSFHKIMRAPVISVDIHGDIRFLRQSIHLRDSHFTVDFDKVKPWYEAMQEFVAAMNEHAAMFKTKPGNILAFDNTRMFHGRLSYEDSPDNHRLLIGCYVDWDEIYSRLRVLRAELGL